MFPLHQIAHVGVSQSRGLKLFSREVILEEFQPMSSLYLIVTDRRTDRQTKAISIPRYVLVHRAVKMYFYGLGTGGRSCICVGQTLTRWQHFSAWHDVITTIFKVWRQIENPTPPIEVYLLEEQSCKMSS